MWGWKQTGGEVMMAIVSNCLFLQTLVVCIEYHFVISVDERCRHNIFVVD